MYIIYSFWNLLLDFFNLKDFKGIQKMLFFFLPDTNSTLPLHQSKTLLAVSYVNP